MNHRVSQNRIAERGTLISRLGKWLGWDSIEIILPVSRIGSSRATKGRAGSDSCEEGRIASISGDLRKESLLLEFQSRAETLIRSASGTILLDLSDVQHADTKAVACLVELYRQALAAQITLEIHASAPLKSCAAVCGVDQLLWEGSTTVLDW